jgi:RNA polymerase sigma-70 factor (ECF subfamily)
MANTLSATTHSAYKDSDAAQLDENIVLAKNGDLRAFKWIYDSHITMVYGLCFRLCADKAQAEDATQEVFIQLWQKLHNFEHQSKFSTWLHSVASNVCISYIRKQKAWWQRMFSISEEQRELQHDSGQMDVSRIESLITKLPERTRIVFVLYAIEGYRHEQIAEMLGITSSTSKVQFHRARALLEEWIDEQ